MATGEELHSTRGRAHSSGSSCKAKSSPTNGRTSRSKNPSTSASPAKPANPSAPSPSTWPPTKPSSSPTTTKASHRPLSHYAFGRIDLFAHLASFAPGLVNAINNAPIISPLIKSILHIHPNRTFPRFAKPFTTRKPRRPPQTHAPPPDVFLWADTFNNYFHPSTMRAAYQVLTTAGFRVSLPTEHLCCGRPLYDFGMLDTAKEYLLKILDALTPQLDAGTPIVVLEPSCASVFRDELTNLLPNDPRAAKLRDQTFLLSEFLVKLRPQLPAAATHQKIIVHGHCHHRATMGMADEMPSSAPPEPTSNSSTPAAAAWPAPSASKKTNTTSRKN